ncbi:serine hydrolase [Myroides sp. 1354]|uniref:glycoside hydrolase family 3 N-terminal domain-containing protein n=1 Tax=unclassified Myroides TaxID=2642485 RepID=UPI002577CB0D|nr:MULTISPECIES: glycoside hydrolase family 3 N-terminal domain-containing protein [unclassified Myroides]MDM1045596.1 serine hydrolase [Myroides sp. R163-1]MDM1056598.1 serine hydrolase [Myroides sp. 1354]MDM1069726.1 serine hydrolase [Myroides sp. 1372]
MKKVLLTLLLLPFLSYGQLKTYSPTTEIQQRQWVDSVYNSMSLEQRIGQLFMVAAYSNKNEKHVQELEALVNTNYVGGLIFFQGGPQRQAAIANRLQKQSKLPMLVGIDGEWGLRMRLDSTYRFPYNMTLGAVQNLDLIEEVGKAMAQQSKRIGLHFNFGPVVDVNINPLNPIIGVRAYGETREIVTDRAVAFMRGYQNEGLFATAKHFPGHGDTSTDSHHKLPLIDLDKDRLHRVELYPYKKLIKNDLSSVMVAHLNLPAYEPNEAIPSSLSYNVVTRLLREELGFEGLIFTDALNMKGVSSYLSPGEVDLAAFMAGNDLLLFSEDVAKAAVKLKEAYNLGTITESRLAYSVKKVLEYKYRVGLNKPLVINTKNLVEDLNATTYDDLNTKLYQEAITVVKNHNKAIPIRKLEEEKIAYVRLGDDDATPFLDMMRNFAAVDVVESSDLSSLGGYSLVVVGYHKVDNPWRNHSFSDEEKAIVSTIAKSKRTILVSFAKPYALSKLEDEIKDLEALVVGYQNNSFAEEAAAQVLFGAIGSKGELPVTITDKYDVGTGIKTKPIHRLGFSTPRNEGLDPKVLTKIDSIAHHAIANQWMPGAQILVARHGKVVYNKSFGYHTYKTDFPVKNTDLYDLASLTKILSTLPMVVKLYNDQKITMQSKLGDLIPVFKKTDKKDITIKDLLTHQSGLPAWLPFYKSTLDSTKHPDKKLYSLQYSPEFPTQVSENLFLKKGYTQVMLEEIAQTKLAKKVEYKYSDLGFISLKEYIESTYHQSLDQLVQDKFYARIGANRLTYLPLRKFDITEIPPTEEDNYYRYTTVQGYVHDMGAAMQGGVAGHAGLFGTALDVAKMMQLYLNEGEYGEERFFSKATFEAFNACVYCSKGNRRGIGFDKPQQQGKPGPTCGCASLTSFGHTGFTGTMTWADPENDLIYVFLSNRTYPDSNVNRLSKENVRENIQQVIYESIIH